MLSRLTGLRNAPNAFLLMPSPVCAVPLSDVVPAIRTGVHFRGSPPTSPDGDVRLVRLRSVDYETATIHWGACPRLLGGDAPSERLQVGDILFSRRGQHRVAFWVDAVPGPAVADAPFFVLRADPKRVDPAFLAWQINAPRAQHWLDRHAQGSSLSMLRKADLKRLPLAMPDLDTQRRLADVHRLLRREQDLLGELRAQHERLLQGLQQAVVTNQIRPSD